MREQSFLLDKDARWLWISVIFVFILTLIYLWNEPYGGRNGGTYFGYFAGSVAAGAMIFLMLYSKRKRAYGSTLGTLKGWLSAHVWIGLALLWIVPLHTGFQFGYNVHTLCYLAIVGAILTGIWGAFLCESVPPRMQARREGFSSKGLLSEVQTLSADIGYLARHKSSGFLKLVNLLDGAPMPSVWKVLLTRGEIIPEIDDAALGPLVHQLNESERADAIKLIGLVQQKIALGNKFYAEVRWAQLLKIWLYIHLPLAVAGFTLLVVHVFAVFYHR